MTEETVDRCGEKRGDGLVFVVPGVYDAASF